VFVWVLTDLSGCVGDYSTEILGVYTERRLATDQLIRISEKITTLNGDTIGFASDNGDEWFHMYSINAIECDEEVIV
jgi:hypothetical protein